MVSFQAEAEDVVSEASFNSQYSTVLPHEPEPESGPGEVQKLFTDAEKQEDKLVAVVVTIGEEMSYDENFREVKPETVPGERVSTYALSVHDAGKLLDLLSGRAAEPGWRELLEDINSVAADSVTFNWECCGACGPHGFGRRRAFGAPSATMQIIGQALQRGFTVRRSDASSTLGNVEHAFLYYHALRFLLLRSSEVMCSDFSLKALLSEWSEALLGPNPFTVLPCQCDHQFQLDFFPEHLKSQDEVPQCFGKPQIKFLLASVVFCISASAFGSSKCTACSRKKCGT